MTTRERTFTKATFDAAQDSWREGEFSDEWRDLRHVMAMRGVIFPPEGTKWDSWDDDAPTQRAVLIRAIRETPELLARCARSSTSWHDLIRRLFDARTEWREQQARLERDEAEDRIDGATHEEAVMTLAEVMRRIADSAGVSS